MRLIGRLILVPLGFVLGALIAGAVLATLGLERITQAMSGRDTPEAIIEWATLVLKGGLMASSFTILPALAVVLIGEIARIRGWLYYVAGGGLAMAAMPLAAGYVQAQQLSLPSTGVLQVLATAGFAGGYIYWMVAGRNA